MSVKPIPEGHNCVSPYLVVDGAAATIDLITRAFGGVELFRVPKPDGGIAHAEVRIGDSIVMIADAMPAAPAMPAMVHVYLPDIDDAYRRAIAAGAVSINPPTDQFYGDRSAILGDKGGNRWCISTHKEDLTHEEIARRSQAAMK